MPKLLYHRNANGVIGVSIRLDGGEKCWILYSRHGCIVRRQGFLFHPRLFGETNLLAAADVAQALDFLFPNKAVPEQFENYALAAFANAVWHCATLAEVKSTLNGAITEAKRRGFTRT